MKNFKFLLLLTFVSMNSFAQSISDLYSKVSPSVVQIIVKTESSEGDGNPYDKVTSLGMGTGVVLDKGGNIITAAHVVEEASEIEVVYFDGSTSSARIVRSNKSGDVALLSANRVPSGIRFAKIGDSDKAKIGEDVIVIGFPMGLSYSLSRGIISGSIDHKNQINEGNQAEYFQTDASINTGNSGGPMFNMDGEVIGIVSSILSRSGGFEGVGFVTKINLAMKLLFNEKGFWMGIDGQFLSEQMVEILNVPESNGMMITTVTPNSPAYFLGLRGGYLKAQIGSEVILLGGDIILSVDGVKLNSMKNIEKIWKSLENKKIGDEINFQVMRAGLIKDYKWIIK